MSPSTQASGVPVGPSKGKGVLSGLSNLSISKGGPPSRGLSPMARMSPIPADFDPSAAAAFRAWDPSHPDAQAERQVKIRACLDLTTVHLTIPSTFRGVLSDLFAAYMVDLDRVASLRKQLERLESLRAKNEFPHSYNSLKLPTLQYQKGVKDLWETNWSSPSTDAVTTCKKACLAADISFVKSQILRVEENISEKNVIQRGWESLAAEYAKRAKDDGMYLAQIISEKDKDPQVVLTAHKIKPLEAELQALQVDLPVYVRKVFDLKQDQIERAVSDQSKKLKKKQEKCEVDTEMKDVASPHTPEVLETINKAVQRQVALAFNARQNAQAGPSKPKKNNNSKVSAEFDSSFMRNLPNALETDRTQEWERFLEEGHLQSASQREESSSQEPEPWRRSRSHEAWGERERKRQAEATVAAILRKPWTWGVPSSYPNELLTLPPSYQVTTLLTRAPIPALESNRFRSSVHVQPGLLIPQSIQHDLSASLKFMFETKIDKTLITKAYADLVKRIRWKWHFLDQVDEPYDPDFEIPEKKSTEEPLRAAHNIECGLAAGWDYVEKCLRTVPEIKNEGPSLVQPNVKRAQDFIVSNNLIVTSTDKNLGVAVFKREWILDQALAIFADTENYTEVTPAEVLHHFNYWGTRIDRLCDDHLVDRKQESTFLRHCLPRSEGRNEWESWKKFVPEAYAIPKIHKNPWKGRPICPGHSLPQNPASKILSKVVRPFIDECPWVIQGSKDFVRKIKDVKIPAGKTAYIVSADVVAFYPSVDVNVLKDILHSFALEFLIPRDIVLGEILAHQRDTRLDYYRRIFEIALAEPVMTFLDKLLVQVKGLPMGAAGSPDAANIYGFWFEKDWMDRLKQNEDILFYGRYLDDIFTLVVADTPDEASAKVSFITLGGVQLLWEPPSQTANFLDLSLRIKEDGSIHHEPFVKAMSHRERIPWSSAHPIDVKKGTFSSEISRLATLCSDKSDYLGECKDAVNLYIARGYPPKLVTSWLKRQQEERWEKRLSPKRTEDPARTLFTLKTHFNEAWKSFNVHELETIIKSQWSDNLVDPSSSRKRKAADAQPRYVKRVRLHARLPPGGSGQSRISFTQGEEESALVPTLGRVLHGVQAQLEYESIRKWTGKWIDTGSFIVSRKRNQQLWDVTRRWNKQVWSTYLSQTGALTPFDPMYEGIVLPSEEDLE